MKRSISIATAKARFAEFVRLAESGETVVLTRHGRPVAQLTPTALGERPPRTSGEIREAGSSYETAPRTSVPPGPGAARSRREAVERLLEESIWPRVPKHRLGTRLDKREREEILGYGSQGV